ncbi:MAG TPA: FAD-dependent oxidoreductase [Polyangiaceae bacterium]|jgi:choline dehydrogenase|nr:FAD-dependent oxidoreductase [Polyangiaceae bacterium]
MSDPIVIVGAGSSGCVLANRLSASGRREVILLEAGPDYEASVLPGDLIDGTRNSMRAHDWTYRHKPSRRAAWSPLPRGKVVGGSSAVNTCIALRGQPEDYDEWASLGLTEWSFEACLPAFKRLENDLDFHDDYHGRSGPLPIRRHTSDELVPFQAAFLEACSELGLPPCADSNAPGRAGFGPHAMNKLEGRRISAAEAYLTPEVRARANLKIVPRTLVRRVLFRNKRTTGLEVEGSSGVEHIETRRVVLSAGAINTPGILLRSGVGPDAEVRRLKCLPVLDAPAVGRRLLDHPGTGVFVLARRGVTVDRRAPIVQTVFRYSSGLCDNPADMLLQPVSFTMILQGFPLFALVSMVGKPRGFGAIRYPDASPTSSPIIESRFFVDAQDRALAAGSLARCRELLATRALSRMGRALYPWSLFGSDSALRRAVLVFCDSGYHPCGTVPMGVAPGENAAVDGRGKVFGLEGLHVVDASVMPTIPSSNIHLPTLMIAERMAEWLDASL